MGCVGEAKRVKAHTRVFQAPLQCLRATKEAEKLCLQACAAVFIMACLIVVRRSNVYRNFSGNSGRPRETRHVTSHNFYDCQETVRFFENPYGISTFLFHVRLLY